MTFIKPIILVENNFTLSGPGQLVDSTSLGSGTPNISTFLRGDSSWQPVVQSFNTRTGSVVLTSTDIANALAYTPYNASNPANYIDSAGAPVQSFNTRTGAITLTSGDITTALTFIPANVTGQVFTGAISVTSSITPSQTNGIVGTTTNNSVNAGSVGEYIQSEVLSGSAISLTTNTPVNITSISLTAGDWDVECLIGLNIEATTVLSYSTGGPNTTSETLAGDVSDITYYSTSAAFGTNISPQFPTRTKRLLLPATTTVYLVNQTGFTVSTVSAYGSIQARRRR